MNQHKPSPSAEACRGPQGLRNVQYQLTDLGLSLEVPLTAPRAWAEEHMAQIDRANAISDTQANPANRG
jgi:DNA-binding HxlR family transcriptional regulator